MFEFIKRLCGYKPASAEGFERSVSMREAQSLKIEPQWTKRNNKVTHGRIRNCNAGSNVNRAKIRRCIGENEALKMPLSSLYKLLTEATEFNDPGRFAKRAFVRRMMREYRKKFGEYPDSKKFHIFHAKLLYEDLYVKDETQTEQ